MRQLGSSASALRLITAWAAPALLVVSMAATAQPASGNLQDDQIRGVVSGKTLALRFVGLGAPMSNPLFYSNWDFRGDGSLCGRLVGSAPGTDCAEVGKWWVRDHTLCWQFQHIGKSTGVNSACGSVRKGQDDLYEIVDTAGKLGTTVFSLAR